MTSPAALFENWFDFSLKIHRGSEGAGGAQGH
jgi:hypothetical protein